MEVKGGAGIIEALPGTKQESLDKICNEWRPTANKPLS